MITAIIHKRFIQQFIGVIHTLFIKKRPVAD